MCVLSPDAAVLPHLERICERLLTSDHASFASRAASLTEAHRALDGSYGIDERTLALLRALEAACVAEHELPLALMADAAGYLKAARRKLELALRRRVQKTQRRDEALAG